MVVVCYCVVACGCQLSVFMASFSLKKYLFNAFLNLYKIVVILVSLVELRSSMGFRWFTYKKVRKGPESLLLFLTMLMLLLLLVIRGGCYRFYCTNYLNEFLCISFPTNNNYNSFNINSYFVLSYYYCCFCCCCCNNKHFSKRTTFLFLLCTFQWMPLLLRWGSILSSTARPSICLSVHLPLSVCIDFLRFYH